MRAYTHWTLCDKCDFVGPMPVVYCGNGQGIANCADTDQYPEHMHRLCERCKYTRMDLMPGTREADENVPDNVVPIRAEKGEKYVAVFE